MMPAYFAISMLPIASDNFVTYKLALQQQLTNDIMVYGSYATGHKGQTF
ncbi:MAG: TonB-dependent receptor [Rhodospirillales bacterium]|nr:TonB-dependent receptor [Rhodospirillales bacterium]